LIKGSTVEKTKTIVQNTEAILKEAGSGVVKVVVSCHNGTIYSLEPPVEFEN
jgi:hypothetical protein